jgi:hypothetical protein
METPLGQIRGIAAGPLAFAHVKAAREMPLGHNSNVTVAGTSFHVQTEENGPVHALIDTTVYFHGHVLHRRTNNYFDLLPLNPERERALKLRVEEQHRTIVEEIRSGKLKLAVPAGEKAAASKAGPSSSSGSNPLHLELLNAKSWLTGKRALLQVAVRDHANHALVGVTVKAKVEGAAQPAEFSAGTGSSGQAQFEFDMPRLSGADAALVIEASNGSAQAHLRFQLRAKPRVPSAS